MSKFIDNLNRLSRGAPQSIGFRTQQPASPKPKIQLVASLAREKAESLTGYVAGADAGLFHISKLSTGVEVLQKISKALPDIPWGVWLEDGWGKAKEFTKVGCDFIVFPAISTPLDLIEATEVGKILELEPSISEGLLRAVNELPIDAVFIAGEEGHFLTWQNLMLFQRFANLVTKPLLTSIPVPMTGSELQALWKAGVSGVITEVKVEQPQNRLKKLRQEIDKLEFSSLRSRDRTEVRLPRMSLEPGTVTIEEEEEEEEE